ncbi:MAG: cupin domain-containing protein [Thermomicrobiales bacterium]
MVDTVAHEQVAHLVNPENVEPIEILGPTIQFLTPLEGDDLSPCVMRGTIPPGVVIPLHSHADPETFIPISGEVEGLAYAADDFTWVRVTPGDVFHVPNGVKHAWRNQTRTPAVMYLISTCKIGRFFQELGTPVRPGAPPPGPPSGEMIRHFLETSERYGYWNAGPEENARIGISLPAA